MAHSVESSDLSDDSSVADSRLHSALEDSRSATATSGSRLSILPPKLGRNLPLKGEQTFTIRSKSTSSSLSQRRLESIRKILSNRGRVVESSSTSTVFHLPAHCYSRDSRERPLLGGEFTLPKSGSDRMRLTFLVGEAHRCRVGVLSFFPPSSPRESDSDPPLW